MKKNWWHYDLLEQSYSFVIVFAQKYFEKVLKYIRIFLGMNGILLFSALMLSICLFIRLLKRIFTCHIFSSPFFSFVEGYLSYFKNDQIVPTKFIDRWRRTRICSNMFDIEKIKKSNCNFCIQVNRQRLMTIFLFV